jgi:hypothetical protein
LPQSRSVEPGRQNASIPDPHRPAGEPGAPHGEHAGFWAYQFWRSAVFTHLVSPKNKVMVPLDRLRASVFGRDLTKF